MKLIEENEPNKYYDEKEHKIKVKPLTIDDLETSKNDDKSTTIDEDKSLKNDEQIIFIDDDVRNLLKVQKLGKNNIIPIHVTSVLI